MKKNLLHVPVLLCCTLGFSACGGSSASNNVDSQAPTTAIAFPPALSSTDSTPITVTGTASDDGTSIDNFATWQANIPLLAGSKTLTIETDDIALNTNTASATISFNDLTPLLSPLTSLMTAH